MMPMNPQMMPFFQQMMQQQGAGGMQPSMAMPQNAAPQINVPNARAPQGGGMQPPMPPPQQQQQPGFLQNMMSSPTQMTNGMNLMNKAGNGISSAYNWLSGPSAAGGAGTPIYNSIAGSMGGAAGATGLDAVGAAAAPLAPIAAAPIASALAPAAGAAGAAGAGAAAGFSMADILPFLFL